MVPVLLMAVQDSDSLQLFSCSNMTSPAHITYLKLPEPCLQVITTWQLLPERLEACTQLLHVGHGGCVVLDAGHTLHARFLQYMQQTLPSTLSTA